MAGAFIMREIGEIRGKKRREVILMRGNDLHLSSDSGANLVDSIKRDSAI
jgi:hypothetical protein